MKRFLLAVIVALLLAACGREAAPPAPARPPLNLATLYWPGAFWVDLAREKGWFREAGIEANFIDTNADYVGSLDAVVSGRLDTQDFTLFDLVSHRSRGADLVMIVCTNQSAGADGIVARAGIERLADLRGRRIGIPKDSYSDYICTTLLQRERIAGSDVTRVDVQGEKAPAALAGGQVDAVITWEPFLSEAAKLAGARRIWDSSQLPGISPAGLTVRRTLLEERPAEVQALVRVWARATDFLLQHPDEACAIIARVNRKTPAEVRALLRQDKILDRRAALTAISYAAGFDSFHGSARVMNDFLLKQNLTTQRLDSSEFLDPRFLKALK